MSSEFGTLICADFSEAVVSAKDCVLRLIGEARTAFGFLISGDQRRSAVKSYFPNLRVFASLRLIPGSDRIPLSRPLA